MIFPVDCSIISNSIEKSMWTERKEKNTLWELDLIRQLDEMSGYLQKRILLLASFCTSVKMHIHTGEHNEFAICLWYDVEMKRTKTPKIQAIC